MKTSTERLPEYRKYAELSFEIKGGQEAAQQFKNNLKMISITSNLGDTSTLLDPSVVERIKTAALAQK